LTGTTRALPCSHRRVLATLFQTHRKMWNKVAY